MNPASIQVRFGWNSVTDSSRSDWLFVAGKKGVRISETLCGSINGPRVYRFFCSNVLGMQTQYIGESGCFEKRCRKYVSEFRLQCQSMTKPGLSQDEMIAGWRTAINSLDVKPEVRLGAVFCHAQVEKADFELQLINFDDFYFNRVLISLEGLSDSFKRKTIENLALLQYDSPSIRTLNRRRDVSQNWFLERQKGVAQHCSKLSSITEDVVKEHLEALRG